MITEYYKVKDGDFRWIKRNNKGYIILKSTEGYKNKQDCENSATRDLSKDSWEFYEDTPESWRWITKSSDGKIVAASLTSHNSKIECVIDAEQFK